MRKSLLLFALPILAVALFIGCEGDEGPQGEQGEQGEQGIQGVQGEQGEPGTANVIYSAWDTLDGAWRDTSMFGGSFKVNHLKSADLTQDIIDNGAVLCYVQYMTNVVPLPYTSSSYTLAFHLDLNKFLFTTLQTDFSGGVSLVSSMQFRYIIIPGGAAAKKSAKDYASMTYDEICELFDIPE